MYSNRSHYASRAAAGLVALAVLAACSDTTTTGPALRAPGARGDLAILLATPSQIIPGADAGYFGNTINANESLRLTTEFWDNISSDNAGAAKCDVGFFANGSLAAGCLNETAGSTANKGGYNFMWGDNGAPAGNGLDASSFMFNGSQAYNVTLLGSYAGAGSTIGWFTKTGTTYTFHPVAAWTAKTLNTVVNIPVQPVGTTWGFFVNTLTPQTNGCGGATNPNYACSDATGGFTAAPNQQFALFANSGGTKFLVGTEDNILLLINDTPNPTQHDSDYNDYIFSVEPIAPPPPPVCDFITFGRLVTTVGNDKVVISGNAGGNAPGGGILGTIEISIGGVQYHVPTIESYGPTTSGVLFPDPFARVITGHSGNNLIELRLHDDPNPGQGEPGTQEGDKVWLKINGSVAVPLQTLDQGNIQLHLNCRGPGDVE